MESNKKNLAIFDLDGTLFDTKAANFYAYKDAVEKYGYSISYDYFCQNFGKNYRSFLPTITSDNDEILEKIHELKKETYKKHIDKIKINKHLFRIIENIHLSYNIVLVTTASKKNCMELLEYFNCVECFDMILTQESVKMLKPDPEGYLYAMKCFNAEPQNTMIFEDSEDGLEAAKKTKATVFKIENF